MCTHKHSLLNRITRLRPGIEPNVTKHISFAGLASNHSDIIASVAPIQYIIHIYLKNYILKNSSPGPLHKDLSPKTARRRVLLKQSKNLHMQLNKSNYLIKKHSPIGITLFRQIYFYQMYGSNINLKWGFISIHYI